MNTFSTISTLALRVIETADDESPRSELIADTEATGVTLTGVVLEAALRWRDQYVLFLTDDIPSEDSLHIYLLSATFSLIDSANLGSMYSTGSFRELNFISPDTLSFRFFGGTVWQLELLTQARPRLPFFSEPHGVSRRFGLSRRMIIRDMRPAATGA